MKFTERSLAFKQENKTSREILPFVSKYEPSVSLPEDAFSWCLFVFSRQHTPGRKRSSASRKIKPSVPKIKQVLMENWQ